MEDHGIGCVLGDAFSVPFIDPLLMESKKKKDTSLLLSSAMILFYVLSSSDDIVAEIAFIHSKFKIASN